MAKIALFLISLCMPHFFIEAAEAPKHSPEEQGILRVHKNLWEALGKRDLDSWSSFVDEDCIFSDEDGEIVTKAEIFRRLRTMPQAYDRSENHRDFIVRIYADTAVINFRLTVHEQFTDTDVVTELRETETFSNRGGFWKLIAAQWGALPINFREPAPSDLSHISEFGGEYEWRPGGPMERLSVKSGRLWSRLSEEHEDHEYLPLGHDKFFLRDDLGTVSFMRDARDRVTGYIYHRADGQEIRVRKIH